VDFGDYFRFVLALAFVLALIGVMAWLLTAVITGMMLVFADRFRAAWSVFAPL